MATRLGLEEFLLSKPPALKYIFTNFMGEHGVYQIATALLWEHFMDDRINDEMTNQIVQYQSNYYGSSPV